MWLRHLPAGVNGVTLTCQSWWLGACGLVKMYGCSACCISVVSDRVKAVLYCLWLESISPMTAFCTGVDGSVQFQVCMWACVSSVPFLKGLNCIKSNCYFCAHKHSRCDRCGQSCDLLQGRGVWWEISRGYGVTYLFQSVRALGVSFTLRKCL